MTKTAVGFFLTILGGSLLSATLGGIFGWILATISPEFVKNLFFIHDTANPASYAFSVGMVFGLFIGAAVAGFACALSVLLKLIRLRVEHRTGPKV